MTRSRAVLAILAVLLIAILLAWYRLPDVVAYIVKQQLRGAGFTEITLDIDSITTTQTQVRNLHATHPAFRLDTSSIEIHYSLAQLWQGNIESIVLDTTQLTLLPGHEESALPVTLPALPDNWLEGLPFQSITFNRVDLTLPEATQGIDHLVMFINMTRVQGKLQVSASLEAPDRQPLQFAFNADSNNNLELVVHEADMTEPFLRVGADNLSMTAGQAKSTLAWQANLVGLRHVTQAWLPELNIPGMFETFRGEGEMSYTTAEQQLRGDINIALTGAKHSVNGPVSLVYQPQQLAVVLGNTFHIETQQQQLDELNIPTAAVTVTDAVHCSYSLSQTTWQCGPSRLQLALPEVRFAPYSLQSTTGSLSLQQLAGNDRDWHSSAEIKLDAVNIVLPDNVIHFDHILTQLQASAGSLQATATLQAVDNKLALEVRARHDLQQQRGTAAIELQPVSLDAAHNIPGKLFRRWPWPVSIESGTVRGEGELNWQLAGKAGPQITQHSVINLRDINGHYKQFPFTGLGGSLTLQGIGDLRLETPSGLRIASFDPGIPISDTRIQGSFSQPPGRKAVISLSDLATHMLGSRISGKDVVVDLNRPDNPFSLQIEGLDITELLKLEQKEGLYGTGKLDGTLPLNFGKDGLRMDAGYLSARAPGGEIRYTGDERVTALAKSNPNIELLLKALNDFRYHVLEASLNYAPTGDLVANLQLQGRNPELEDGRPVHLNINLEENVLTLLRSLQFADEISRKIGENIERGKKRP